MDSLKKKKKKEEKERKREKSDYVYVFVFSMRSALSISGKKRGRELLLQEPQRGR